MVHMNVGGGHVPSGVGWIDSRRGVVDMQDIRRHNPPRPGGVIRCGQADGRALMMGEVQQIPVQRPSSRYGQPVWRGDHRRALNVEVPVLGGQFRVVPGDYQVSAGHWVGFKGR